MPYFGIRYKPVREVIKNKNNGYLVDFFDVNKISKKILDLLGGESFTEAVRLSARESSLNYSAQQGVESYRRLFEELLGKRMRADKNGRESKIYNVAAAEITQDGN